MAKNKFGKFVAFATISGLVAAGVSYFVKYKSFHDELDEDFHDFEGEDDEFDGELPHASEAAERTYVSLNDQKEKAMDMAADAVEKAKDMADTAADKAEDMAETLSDKAEDAADAVEDKMEDMADAAKDKAKEVMKKASTTIEEDM